MSAVEADDGRNTVSDGDLHILISIISHVEAAFLPDMDPSNLVDALLQRLRRDLVRYELAHSEEVSDQVAAVQALNFRLRRSLGEDVSPSEE
ncbi:hypothetical protein [Dactylosporangium salmoneum]|uniref:Uncharacterized protein n=1 Tax=Dactylosporangium salmoneum TaxID=53361 RepID=A0ABP5TG03_9ACTN